MTKYCECKGGLILANLETGKEKCPLCKLPKKLNHRLKNMSKMYKSIVPIGNSKIKNTGYGRGYGWERPSRKTATVEK